MTTSSPLPVRFATKAAAYLAALDPATQELDQSLHRAIGVAAAALTAWLATRRS